MPKLIIPNAHELYKPEGYQLNRKEAIARQFYNLRFLWLLDPGDIILLPELPPQGFLFYLASIKQINPDSLTIITLEGGLNAVMSESLANSSLIQRLQKIIMFSTLWSIQTCYVNQAIVNLAENLGIPLDPKWHMLVKNDFVRKMNSKVEFRKLASSYNLPVPEGQVCISPKCLTQAIQSLLMLTGQIIIKQEHTGGGRGNIGMTIYPDVTFTGVIETILINKDTSIDEITDYLWANYSDALNQQFVVEAYYPNTGTFTAMVWIPSLGQAPILLNYSEIRMKSTWVGVQIPAHALSSDHVEKLVTTSMQLARIVQEHGYQGFICCDAIRTFDNQILFTEINVRPGAETHAHVLASHLFGADYINRTTILTRKDVKILSSFSNFHQTLEKEGLLISRNCQSGIALLTVEDRYSKQAEYLVAAPNLSSAYDLEEKVISLLHKCS